MRTVFYDGDFRKYPKTKIYCAICQRDLKTTVKKFYVWLGETPIIVHPDDINGTEILATIGSECKKKVPKEFLMNELHS